jgi:hypothetical protein
MLKFIRPVVIFAFLYIASCAAIYPGLPRLMEWSLSRCINGTSVACSVSSAFLSWWWLAFLPVIFVVTLLFNSFLAKRRAA